MDAEKNGKLIKVLKIIGIIGTAVSAMVGAFVSVSSLYDVYRAKSGYKDNVANIQKNHAHIDENREALRLNRETLVHTREELKFVKSLLLSRMTETPVPAPPPTTDKDMKEKLDHLPRIPEQKTKTWDDLPIQQRAMP